MAGSQVRSDPGQNARCTRADGFGYLCRDVEMQALPSDAHSCLNTNLLLIETHHFAQLSCLARIHGTHGTAVIHIGAASSIIASNEKALNGARDAAYYS